jgi:hypothetical protein
MEKGLLKTGTIIAYLRPFRGVMLHRFKRRIKTFKSLLTLGFLATLPRKFKKAR